SGSGIITFEAIGPSLRLFLNNTLVLVGTATDTSFTKGGVGISGGAGTIFANFSASAITLQNQALPGFTDIFTPTTDGQLSTSWTDQLGNFTVASNQATAGSAALNMAIVNGGTIANDTVTTTIGAVPVGGFAAVVARYQSDSTMYFACVRNTN